MPKRPEFITLDEMDQYFGDPEPMPPLRVVSKRFNILDLFAEPSTATTPPPTDTLNTPLFDDETQKELDATFLSVRAGRKPSTVMHALALRDELDIPRLAAITGRDVLDIAATAEHLVAVGLVKQATDAEGYPHFSVELGSPSLD